MVLPEDLERRFHREIIEFEEEHKMQYITTAERIGMEKGLEQGLEKGLEKGTVIGEILLAQRMLKLTLFTQKELEQKRLDDLHEIFTSLETQLLEYEKHTES